MESAMTFPTQPVPSVPMLPRWCMYGTTCALWVLAAVLIGSWLTGRIAQPAAQDPRFNGATPAVAAPAGGQGMRSARANEPVRVPSRSAALQQSANPLDPEFWMTVFSNAATWLVKGFTAGMALIVNSLTAPLQLMGSSSLPMVFRTPEALTVDWAGDTTFGSPAGAATVLSSAATAVLVVILTYRLIHLMTAYSRYTMTSLLISGIGGLVLIWGMWAVCRIMIKMSNSICDAIVSAMFGGGLPIIPYPDPGVFGGLSLTLALVLFFYWLMICLMAIQAFRRIVLLNLLLIMSPLVGLAFATNRGWNYGRVWFFRFLELLVTPIIWAAALGFGRTLTVTWTARADTSDQLVAATIGAILATFTYSLTLNAPYHVRLAANAMSSHVRWGRILGSMVLLRTAQQVAASPPPPVPTQRLAPAAPTQRLVPAVTGPTTRLTTTAVMGSTAQLNMETTPSISATVPLGTHAATGATVDLASHPSAAAAAAVTPSTGTSRHTVPTTRIPPAPPAPAAPRPMPVIPVRVPAAPRPAARVHAMHVRYADPLVRARAVQQSQQIDARKGRRLHVHAPQTYRGAALPVPTQIHAVRDRFSFGAYAPDGGLLTTPAEGSLAGTGATAWPITPDPEAPVAVIDSQADYNRLTALYPCAVDPRYLSFEAMGQDYAGVLITAGGVRLGPLQPLAVPGTMWFRWAFTDTAATTRAPQGAALTSLRTGDDRAAAVAAAQQAGARLARSAGVYGPQAVVQMPSGPVAQNDAQPGQVNRPVGAWTVSTTDPRGAQAQAVVIPHASARIAVVRDERDYELLRQLYPNPYEPAYLSFAALATDFDAFHVAPSGLNVVEAATHMGSQTGTVWFRPAFDPHARPSASNTGHVVGPRAQPSISSPRSANSPSFAYATREPDSRHTAWDAASVLVRDDLCAWRAQLGDGAPEAADVGDQAIAAPYHDQVEESYDPIYDDPDSFARALTDETARLGDTLEHWQADHPHAEQEQVRAMIDERLTDLRDQVIRGMLGYERAPDADTGEPVAVCRACGRPRGVSRRRRVAPEQETSTGQPVVVHDQTTVCPLCGG